MRAFIAAEIPAEIQDTLSRVQNKLQRSGAVVKWVEARNIHLTLRFLGEVPGDRTEELCEAIEKALRGLRSFRVSLCGLGSFPVRGCPRVIWAGIKEGGGELRVIAEKLRYLPDGCAEPAEGRPFSAHVTLGRLKENRNIAALKKLLQDPQTAGSLTGAGYVLSSITLLSSSLGAPGPRYTPLRTFSLTTT